MRPIALPFVAAMIVAACSAAPAASSPPASPSSSPTAVASPSASPTPSVEPSPTVAPSPSAPVIGKAPAGAWSAVQWVSGDPLPVGRHPVTVRGWSGGFVAFEQSPGSNDSGEPLPVVIRSSSSTDGVHWSRPLAIETGFEGNLAITSIVEGPSGLLALGYPYGDTCGGPDMVAALWASDDGRTWERLPMPKALASGSVQSIAGGPAGFIAFGSKSDHVTQAIWTSQDGRAWTARKLPTVTSGTLALDGVASFAPGFVVVGSVLGEEGCGGATHMKAAAWFSADGAAWMRADLPGAATDPKATLMATRVGDHLVISQSLNFDAPNRTWSSSDGRTWAPATPVSSDLQWAAISDGNHVVIVLGPGEGVGASSLIGIDETASATTFRQDGYGPLTSEDGPGWVYAVGPTGVLAVRADGGASWLGVPS